MITRELFIRATSDEAATVLMTHLGLSDGTELIPFVEQKRWQVGSILDGPQLNDEILVNVILMPPLSENQAFLDNLETLRAEGIWSAKPSRNGRGDSEWHRWNRNKLPALARFDEAFLFRQSASGSDRPDNQRQRFAI